MAEITRIPIQSYGVMIAFGIGGPSKSIDLNILVSPDTTKRVNLTFSTGDIVFGTDNLEVEGAPLAVRVTLPLSEFDPMWQQLQSEAQVSAEWKSTGHSQGFVIAFSLVGP